MRQSRSILRLYRRLFGQSNGLLFGLAVAVVALGSASSPEALGATGASLADQLTRIRGRVLGLEQDLIDTLHTQTQARANVKKIHKLMSLQQEERRLGQQRLMELERTVGELEIRRGQLRERIEVQKKAIRKFLVAIEASSSTRAASKTGLLHLPEHEKMEAPRRKVLSNLVDRGLKEIEVLRVDLADADHLETRIRDERQQLAYLFQDLKEQESILELNRQLQADLLKKRHHERASQLENYKRLKSAEAQVERLISDFNSRRELERAVETERAVNRAQLDAQKSAGLMRDGGEGVFTRLRGQLPMPVSAGKILTGFGRVFDHKTKLYIFKKGVDIAAGKRESVKAISAGRVAFAGELPNYGRVTIIDHGEHYYSLCGRLGALQKKTGEAVSAGEAIGSTDDLATPVYFEIRARNVAVNPLQWLSN